MIVYIDSKEKPERIKEAIKFYSNQGISVKLESLEEGDYKFTSEDSDEEVVFEYKTIIDFLGSIPTMHLYNQVVNQLSYKYSFVVIEGDFIKTLHENPQAIIRSFEHTIKMFEGMKDRILSLCTPIIEEETEFKCFYRMLRVAKKCLDNKVIVNRLPVKSDNSALNYLMNIKYVSDVRSRLIVNELGLETKADLDSLTVDDLCSIDGIGESTARLVINAIK